MSEEFFKIIVLSGLSLIVCFIILVPIFIWRIIKRKPLVPKGEKLASPTLFYIGIILFGGFSIVSFLTSTPYFGSVFLLIFLACIGGLIAYKKGWRG